MKPRHAVSVAPRASSAAHAIADAVFTPRRPDPDRLLMIEWGGSIVGMLHTEPDGMKVVYRRYGTQDPPEEPT